MATVVNYIDTTLQAAPYRSVNLPTAQVLLTPTAPAFHVTTGGANSPASITFNASLIDLQGTISFSCTGGTLTNITATSADLTYANMSGTSATVTASITVNGMTYSAPCSVSKVTDGANGTNGSSVFAARVYLQASSQPAAPTGGTFNFSTATLTPPTGWGASQPTSSTTPTWVALYTFSASTPGATVTAGTWATPVAVAQNGSTGGTGPRGAGHWYATGSSWSDTTADATCPGGKVVGDVVTISSGSYVMTKRWGGASWDVLSTVIDGTLLVSGSVLAAALAAGSVTTEKMLISGSNLIPNPDFATGDFTNWRPFGTPANSSVIPASTAGTPTGAKSANVCKMLNGAGGQVSIFAFSSAYADTNAPRDGFAVTEGEQYNIKIDMAKTSDLSASTLAVVVYFYKSDGTHSSSILVLDLHATLTTSFATYSGSFTVPAGALRCWPYVNFVGTAGSVYWSNLRCARMADSALVVDGGIKANHLSVTSLNAITATTGALTVNDLLTIAAGGAMSFGQTAYDTGNGGWIQGGSTPKWSMRSSNGKYLRIDVSAGVFEFNGVSVTGGTVSGSTVTGSTIDGSSTSLSNGYAIAQPSDISASIAATGSTTTIATVTLSQSGGKTPYQKPQWSSNYVSNGGVNIQYSLDSTGTVATIKANSKTSGSNSSMDITVTGFDANGLACTKKFNVYCDAT